MDLNRPTNISAALRQSAIDPLDAEVLLAHVLEKNRPAGRPVRQSLEGEGGSLGEGRAWLLAHGGEFLSKEQERTFQAFLSRRKRHEPIAYILGEKEFYGRKFFVDRRVLIPRPSTETLIDETKKLYDALHRKNVPFIDTWYRNHIVPADNEMVIFSHVFPQKLLKPPHFAKASRGKKVTPRTIVDVGTGSGCIGITLALELPNVHVLCTDTSVDALDVARENAKRHEMIDRMQFQKADLLTTNYSLLTTPFLVVSNPPYIPEVDAPRHFRASLQGTPLSPDVINYEPHEALFAGPDGMDILKPLLKQCRDHPHCLGFVVECRQEQAKKLTQQL